MYDIAIIGLGPAGATLARLLSEKYKVLVIDKKVSMGNVVEGYFHLIHKEYWQNLTYV